MKNRVIQILIIAVLLIGVGFVIYQNVSSSMEVIREGKEAPDFTLESLAGEPIKLSDLRGKGVLINFWATTCESCLNEMPAIQRVYDRYKNQGLEVLGINTGEGPVAVSGYVNRLKVNFPILMDREYEVTDLYQTGPLPRSLFISPDGKVKLIYLGEMNEEMIEASVKEILPRSGS